MTQRRPTKAEVNSRRNRRSLLMLIGLGAGAVVLAITAAYSNAPVDPQTLCATNREMERYTKVLVDKTDFPTATSRSSLKSGLEESR